MNPLIKLLAALIFLLLPINMAVIEVNNQYSSSSPAVITWPGMNPDPNCYIYMPGGICQQCSFGYYFDMDRCVTGQRNCKTYNSNKNICQSCYMGSKLMNDTCVINTQTYLLQGCSYSSGDQCLYCSDGYYFNYDGVCELMDTLCDEFDFNSKICKKCYKGYTYKQNWGKCVASGLQLNSYCSSWQNYKCLSCIKDYYLNQLGQCVQQNKNCLEIDSKNPHKCQSCYSGYLLINGNCEYDPRYNSNALCLKLDQNGTCISCSQRSILDSNNKCTVVNPLCLTYNNNGFCLSCYQSYKLIENLCIPSEYAAKNIYCSSWSQGICRSCIPWAYFDSNNICQLVNTLCSSYNQQNGLCTGCYGGYYLANGRCNAIQLNPFCLTLTDNNICTACYNGYYLNSQTNICQLADSLCLTITQDNKCLSCYNGYRIINFKCVVEQDNCTNYNEKGLCSQCNKGLHIQSQKCVSNRNNCAQYDDLQGICVNCLEKYIISNGFCLQV